MKKSAIKEFPEYFDYYIHLNEDVTLEEAFEKSLHQIDELDIIHLKHIGLQVYAEGKWTIPQIIQHLTDWERIWCYRTIVSVRKEGNIPEALDQEIMASNSNANELPIEQLVGELRAVRVATQALFASFNQQILETNCRFYNCHMPVLAMGFNIIGHQLHHFKVIKERYMSLVK